ncbi:MAG: NAD(+)/NADH kinase [Candidatus Thermoplasmatota archaeon]|uniref:NAD kinase n=2 Tax=Candidatus Sysuiplasma superficiale TaxID=2823368 RepID=A0A8J8CAR5_9ARCH|nr:NAD(+)/NADH kinase [Candidatus Sysuiplasma superficiale]MCL4346980.1 NAD(+)/NADH kinase [Candidatus Thermoplasmatota archaeon]MCL5437481.1 NAD(+)/NADH kinase [Candidatus Thermoplasmatota archaeon]
MKIALYANSSLSAAAEIASEIYSLLDGNVTLEAETAAILGRKGVPLGRIASDVLIVVGGDGTMLKTLMRYEGPVLGVNAGDVGFLTEVGRKGIARAVRMLREGRYTVEEKIKLKTVVSGRRMDDAVNEALVTSADPGKVRHFNLSISGYPVGLVKSDGIIVSTPTGSTSYSLAAGGPIVDPSASVFVISPVAPYGISSRPIVTGNGSVIELTVEGERRCILVIDGQVRHALSGRETVTFSLSEKKASFVSLDHDFYRRIRTKLTG